VRQREPKEIGDLHHRTGQRVDLQGASALDVLGIGVLCAALRSFARFSRPPIFLIFLIRYVYYLCTEQ
jgi:hypothetical protein